MKPVLSRDLMVPAVNGDQMSRAMRFQGVLRRPATVDDTEAALEGPDVP